MVGGGLTSQLDPCCSVEDPDGYFLVFRPGLNQEESTELVLEGWLGVIPHVQAWAGRVKDALSSPTRSSHHWSLTP